MRCKNRHAFTVLVVVRARDGVDCTAVGCVGNCGYCGLACGSVEDCGGRLIRNGAVWDLPDGTDGSIEHFPKVAQDLSSCLHSACRGRIVVVGRTLVTLELVLQEADESTLVLVVLQVLVGSVSA
eukprot:1387218-Amphidinium_carterae.3